jgi:NAD(P)-dependent dehydrogenase (short-subunit alcohol dehydrogenase family)
MGRAAPPSVTGDLLVNAAGVFFPKPFLDHTEADYDRYLEIDRGMFFVTQRFVANLVEKDRPGAIVNIGSMWAQQASRPRRHRPIRWPRRACTR